VTDLTWKMFGHFIARSGPKPVLVEWDSNVPDFATLMREADKATNIMAAITQSIDSELHHAAA